MVLAAQVERQSVQVKPDATQNPADALDFFIYATRGPILDVYGTQQRQGQLLRIYRNEYNWPVQGAFSNIGKQIASTKFEIKSEIDTEGDFGIDYWQELLANADFGAGWLHFCQKGVLDYLRFDRGWFIEVIGPGNPETELTQAVTGIAHLDALRCLPTGDPLYPVIYVDRESKLHKMHRSRVIQIVDAPDGDERRPGYGLCALSRAVSIAQREVQIGRYVEAYLDDKPPPGIVEASGMTQQQRDKMFALYQDERETDQGQHWGNQVWFFGPDRDAKVEIEFKAFQQAPEKFDLEVYTARVDMPALALAIGVDIQDLWQLTGGNIGSGEQSNVLHQKSKGKTIGTLFAAIERAVNWHILPDGFEMDFDTRDVQEEQQQAAAAQTWLSGINSVASHMSPEEIRILIAGVDERFHDALTEENGVIREFKPPEPEVPTTPGNNTNNPASRREDESAGKPTTNRTQPVSEKSERTLDMGRRHADTLEKTFQATRLNFEADWEDLIIAAVNGSMSRSRFRIVARALLSKHGLQAYKDGLQEGGVTTDALEDEDQTIFAAWLAERSVYVGGLADRIYDERLNVNAQSTADMWANNSLQAARYDGLSSANRNGMFEFGGVDGVESCTVCQVLKGQRHRLKVWTQRLLRPGVDIFNFPCHAVHCNHILFPTTDKAFGRLPTQAWVSAQVALVNKEQLAA
jgi:hypothetical protein